MAYKTNPIRFLENIELLNTYMNSIIFKEFKDISDLQTLSKILSYTNDGMKYIRNSLNTKLIQLKEEEKAEKERIKNKDNKQDDKNECKQDNKQDDKNECKNNYDDIIDSYKQHHENFNIKLIKEKSRQITDLIRNLNKRLTDLAEIITFHIAYGMDSFYKTMQDIPVEKHEDYLKTLSQNDLKNKKFVMTKLEKFINDINALTTIIANTFNYNFRYLLR